MSDDFTDYFFDTITTKVNPNVFIRRNAFLFSILEFPDPSFNFFSRYIQGQETFYITAGSGKNNISSIINNLCGHWMWLLLKYKIVAVAS